MKTRQEARARKPKRPGGKVLQRLFAFLGRRNPALNDPIVATVAVPRAVRQKTSLTKKAMRAKQVTAASASRTRRPHGPTHAFAAAMIKAAKKLGASKPRRAPRRGKAKVLPAGVLAPWQSIGPTGIPNGQTYGTNRVTVAGRVSSVAVDPGNPKHLLVGGAGGGIWESADTGGTWTPRTDLMPSLAIGAITFDPSAPSRVYAGSGEGNFYSQLGAGVFKSTNGGTTWTVAASAPFVGVGFYNLVVDPKTPAVLYAATTAGFFKSTNSGASWTVKRAVGCWDISVHPNGGAVEILATFADGLFVSTNGGTSFTAVALPSKPAGAWVRLVVDRVAASPDVAYVFGAIGTVAYLWRRSGTTWRKITTPPKLDTSQAWYDWYVAATPNSVNQVFLGAIEGWRGDQSGTTWKWTNIITQGSNSIHPDQHCLAFSPGNPKIIYAGNDGGLFRSGTSGAGWTSLNKGLGITEMEYLASDPTTSKWLMAGLQDNGTIRYTGGPTWDHIADGDGGDCGVNQFNPNIVYHSYYDVSLERSTNKGDTWTDMAPPNLPSLFYPPVEVFGPTVAIGATSLAVTRTGVPPWKTVALGLAAQEFPSAMRAIDASTIIIGTTRGRMLKMVWSGSAWSKTQLTSPAPRYISCIAVDPSNPQRYWITMSQLGGALVYRSDNAGVSWVNCTANLPGIPMNAVVVDPASFKRVWVAADLGVYQTVDLGASWGAFTDGLPNALAADLIFHKQDRVLVCATRNRGAWIRSVP